MKDVDLLYTWANDVLVRSNSYSSQQIDYETHVQWLRERIQSEDYMFLIFFKAENEPVGLVRFEKNEDKREAIISISVNESDRGKGYSVEMLKQATSHFLQANHDFTILAYIFKSNNASFHSFKKAGYKLLKETVVNNVPSYTLYESK